MNPSFTYSVSIVAAPSRVMWAFFNPAALASWWQTSRSVTVPRVLGAYSVEWHLVSQRIDCAPRYDCRDLVAHAEGDVVAEDHPVTVD